MMLNGKSMQFLANATSSGEQLPIVEATRSFVCELFK